MRWSMINKKAEKNGSNLTQTPPSVCLEKGTPVTPSTQRQGSCSEIPKDPPLPKRTAHRTTNVGYPSCIEKTKKGGKSNNSRKTMATQKKQVDKHCGTPSNTQAPQGFVFPYSPQSVGGIQMVDGDGSIGYFTGVSGEHTVPANFSRSETELQSMYRAGFIPYQYTQYRPMYPYGVLAATSHSPPTPRSASSLAGGRPMFRPIAPKPPMSTYGCNQQAPTQHQSNHFVQQVQKGVSC